MVGRCGRVEGDLAESRARAGEGGGVAGWGTRSTDQHAGGGTYPTTHREGGEPMGCATHARRHGGRARTDGGWSRVGQQWLEAALADLARVADDGERGAHAAVQAQMPRCDLERGSRNLGRCGRAGQGAAEADHGSTCLAVMASPGSAWSVSPGGMSGSRQVARTAAAEG